MADQSSPLPNESLPRELNRLAFWWALVFGVIFGMWMFDEAKQAGQQFADPLLPVLWCSVLFGSPLYYVELIFRIESARRRRRACSRCGARKVGVDG